MISWLSETRMILLLLMVYIPTTMLGRFKHLWRDGDSHKTIDQGWGHLWVDIELDVGV